MAQNPESPGEESLSTNPPIGYTLAPNNFPPLLRDYPQGHALLVPSEFYHGEAFIHPSNTHQFPGAPGIQSHYSMPHHQMVIRNPPVFQPMGNHLPVAVAPPSSTPPGSGPPLGVHPSSGPIYPHPMHPADFGTLTIQPHAHYLPIQSGTFSYNERTVGGQSPNSDSDHWYSEEEIDIQGFILRSFPYGTPDFERYQKALEVVMLDEWKVKNQREPSNDVLLQFMWKDEVEDKWRCRFWDNGAPCESACRKAEHAKNHVRRHINHRPFACDGRCSSSDGVCTRRYTSTDARRTHQKGTSKCCEICGEFMTPQNYARHRQSVHHSPQA
ncbi:hypothetical protein CPB86DRAFT_814897 [Serendipita vermifera]|nr:hypothetical protein CPB86DRAFT_814897 [Serendipita vermifera]